MNTFLNSFFKLEERNTNVRTEVLAGITTFLSMAYILFVNPSILAAAGMPEPSVFVATAIAAIMGTLIMGLYANYPVAQAPGMGMNAFFAYTISGQLGYTFQEALFIVFCSGLIFMLISVTSLREKIINAIPASLKYAVSAGVGLFIAFVGLRGAEIIVSNDATSVGLGDFAQPSVVVALFGIVVTFILVAKKIRGDIFIGLVATAIFGMIIGAVNVPTAIVSSVPSLSPIAMQLFDVNIGEMLSSPSFYFVVFSVLFLDFFDTAGTLMGVATRGNLLDEDGRLIDASKALMADATATTFGAMVGTSSVTSYAESVVGVEQGGRTGLTAVVVAIGFALSIFFSPLLSVVTSSVTAPALIVVGALMMTSLKNVNFDDFADSVGSFFTVIFMVLSYSIAEGIAVGFTMYTIIKVAQGKGKEVSPIMFVLSCLFVLHFIFNAIG